MAASIVAGSAPPAREVGCEEPDGDGGDGEEQEEGAGAGGRGGSLAEEPEGVPVRVTEGDEAEEGRRDEGDVDAHGEEEGYVDVCGLKGDRLYRCP